MTDVTHIWNAIERGDAKATDGLLPLRSDLLIAMAACGDYGPGDIGTAVAYEQGGHETGPRASGVALGAEDVHPAGMRERLRDK